MLPAVAVFLLMSTLTSSELDRLRWQKRVVLIAAADETDPRISDQQRKFQNVQSELDRRDMQVFEVTGSNPIRSKFGVEEKAFAVILLGKDGSVKARKSDLVDPSDLFKLVDSMPMRKEEMKHR